MTDDDVERRLRSALHAKAVGAVGPDSPLPPMAGRGARRAPLRIMPTLAAAALVASVIGGSTLVATSDRHPSPGHQPASVALAESSTTTAIDAPAPTATLSSPRTSPLVPVPIATFSSSGHGGTPSAPSPRSSRPSMPPAPSVPPPSTSAPVATRTSPSSNVPPTTRTAMSSPRTASRSKTPGRTRSAEPSDSVAPTASPTTPPKTTTTPPATSTEPAPPASTPSCPTASLTIDVGGGREADTHGGEYDFLNVVNHGATCSLSGFPTVRIYDGSGALVAGPAPHRAGSIPHKLVLGPGDGAQFEVYDVYDGSPACAANYQSGRHLQTYLPGQHTAITTDPWGYGSCQFTVTALHAPTSQQPTV